MTNMSMYIYRRDIVLKGLYQHPFKVEDLIQRCEAQDFVVHFDFTTLKGLNGPKVDFNYFQDKTWLIQLKKRKLARMYADKKRFKSRLF